MRRVLRYESETKQDKMSLCVDGSEWDVRARHSDKSIPTEKGSTDEGWNPCVEGIHM